MLLIIGSTAHSLFMHFPYSFSTTSPRVKLNVASEKGGNKNTGDNISRFPQKKGTIPKRTVYGE